jgi:hypothetical protein
MAFSEETKRTIRKKAMYKCCFCQSLDIEIHHIIPQKEGGSDDIDNGAPLCPNCHERYGNDPLKRKRIIEARDNWYEIVERMYPDNRQINAVEIINERLDQFQQNQISLDDFKQVLSDYNQMLFQRTSEMIHEMTKGTVVVSASAIVNASFSPSPSPSPELPEE